MEETIERLSGEAKVLARIAPKASTEAVRELWRRGISVTVLEGDQIVRIAPDGTKTFLRRLNPLRA